MEPAVVVHGGVGSPPEWSDGCEAAAAAAYEVLSRGGWALDAVEAAVRLLEADGRYNAGRGSVLRLDGETLEMDAALMTSDGRIGAVAALSGFLHPISAARAAMATPHVLFAGAGAARLAERYGVERLRDAPTDRNRERHRETLAALRDRTIRRPAWREAALDRIWNFPSPLPPELTPRDTVGAVARDAAGRLAVANSTGGAVPMLLGRVGDSPLPGCGFWAGPAGAVATTGIGEEIVRRLAAREIHDRIARGLPATGALAEVVAMFPEECSFGAIAISPADLGVAANRPMAHAAAP